ncbi:uncharacterized protein LOC144122961 isoform X2 [Amblyomma americanum]
MESPYDFFALKNQAGIQTMGTIFFVFAVMSGQDMIMRLKFASINTSFLEICLALVPRMLLVFVTICVDLLLVIGIEDDSPRAMKLFVNWTAAEVVADFLLCVTMVAFKSTRRNVKTVLGVFAGYVIFLLVKGVCAYRVRTYARSKKKKDEEPKPEETPAEEPQPSTSGARNETTSDSPASPSGSLHRRAVGGRRSDPEETRVIEDSNAAAEPEQ